MEEYQAKMKQRYDEKTRSRSFKVGDPVYMYILPQQSAGPRWIAGTVSHADDSSCVITLSDGRSFRRHFDHIRLRRPFIADETAELPPASLRELPLPLPLPPAESRSPPQQGHRLHRLACPSLGRQHRRRGWTSLRHRGPALARGPRRLGARKRLGSPTYPAPPRNRGPRNLRAMR